eukprot:scaffold4244_cov167-Amphora_coffeaeformis.AAC.32
MLHALGIERMVFGMMRNTQQIGWNSCGYCSVDRQTCHKHGREPLSQLILDRDGIEEKCQVGSSYDNWYGRYIDGS